MRIALISGSRSDRNALVMVNKVLWDAKHASYITNLWSEEKWNARPSASTRAVEGAIANVSAWIEGYDLAIVHGDRHEILGAAVAANLLGVPIAHIGGGDITEGSQDDCFRHAITKLSHLHFAANQDAADRIIQMGEESDRIHVTGCPGIDMVMATSTMDYIDTVSAVGLGASGGMGGRGRQKIILVLFHPNTLGDTRPELEALSVALARRTEALVLLGPNADAGSNLIRDEWKRLAANRPDTIYRDNVEPKLFYSLMKHCDVMVGNSSAGFYEAPCFGIPVVNIGDRQLGRPAARNIFTRSQTIDDIYAGIVGSLGLGHYAVSREMLLYGDGHAAERIAVVLTRIDDPKKLLRKKFHQIAAQPMETVHEVGFR